MCPLWLLYLLLTTSTSRPAFDNEGRDVIEIIVKSNNVIIEVGVRQGGKDEDIGEEEEETEEGTGGEDVDVLKELEQLEAESEQDEPVNGRVYDGQVAESFFESYDNVTDGLRPTPAYPETHTEETVDEKEREGTDGAEEFLELIVIPKRQHVRYDKPKEDVKMKKQHTTFYKVPGVNIVIRMGSTGETKEDGEHDIM